MLANNRRGHASNNRCGHASNFIGVVMTSNKVLVSA